MYYYDTIVIPLLHRMSNLEELRLYFNCSREESFVDGNDLKTNILIHLPRLTTFKFNIFSFIDHYNQSDLLSNEDIRNTFRDFSNNEIISCVDYFPDEKKGQCHIYSYPFTLTSYERITNNFPGGLFPYVRKVSLFDEQPFQHEFFIRIQKSFPFIKKLTVSNWKAQNHKQHEKSKDDNRDLSLIHYQHLTSLFLTEVHDDYIEEFLLDTKTALPFNLTLYVDYYSIRRVTHHFKRIETRINCSKINCVYLDNVHHFSKDFRNYFLSTEYM
ncbi:unnamed protein product [Rotaria sordida]|uniref:Uncharacterized protein n=2 Tax=Rotaria sordida TaxID=392033 RepID=A0A819U2H8_9BILA|nr:unnamed protein product [Rotaria sordida]